MSLVRPHLAVPRRIVHTRAALVALLSLAPVATRAQVNVSPPASTLDDVNAYHQLYANGMDARPGTEDFVPPLKNRTWATTVTNGGMAAWTSFFIEAWEKPLRTESVQLANARIGGFGEVRTARNVDLSEIRNPASGLLKYTDIPNGKGKPVATARSISLDLVSYQANVIVGQDYHWRVMPISRALARPAAPQGQQGMGGGSGMSYDGASGALVIGAERIAGTGSPGDPLVDATISMPGFERLGPLADGNFVFGSTSPQRFMIGGSGGTFLDANLSTLTYLTGEKLFYGILGDVQLGTSSGSPWIGGLTPALSPGSGATLYFTYQPNEDIGGATDGFERSRTSGGTARLFVASSLPDAPLATVPEPGTVVLVGGGLLLGLGASRRRRRVAS